MPQNRTVSSKTNEIDIYEYDKQLGWIYNLLKKEMSAENFNLSQKYDTYMVKDGLAKGTRLKHLKMLVSLDRLLKKNWSDVSGDDIDILIRRIMDNYGNTKGKETETSRDHKKVLKIFFRWYKFGSRNFREACNDVEDCNIIIGGIGIGPDVPPSTGTLTLPSITVDGKLGFIMLGHVAGNGQTGQDIEHVGVKIGTVIDNDPLSNRTSDSAFVESVSGSNLKMDIFNHNDPNNHYNVVDAIDSSDTDLFDPVLRSGISEGEQPGAIGAKGVTITDAIGTLTNQVITTGTVSDNGDSGGPYFSLPDANNNVDFYGLHVGWACVLNFNYDDPDTSITSKSVCTTQGGLVSSFYSPWESIQSELNLQDIDGSLRDDNVGVAQKNSGTNPITFHLRNGDGTTTPVNYGNSAVHEPITGDWDGDGDTDVGVTEKLSGTNPILFHLLDRDTGLTIETIVYGNSAVHEPITGDWDGN